MRTIHEDYVCVLCHGVLCADGPRLVCRSCGEAYGVIAGDIALLIPSGNVADTDPLPEVSLAEMAELAEKLHDVDSTFRDLVRTYCDALGDRLPRRDRAALRAVFEDKRRPALRDDRRLVSRAFEFLNEPVPRVRKAAALGVGWGQGIAFLRSECRDELASPEARLFALDVNPALLVIARRLARETGISDVSLAAARADLPLPFPEHSIQFLRAGFSQAHPPLNETVARRIAQALAEDAVVHWSVSRESVARCPGKPRRSLTPRSLADLLCPVFSPHRVLAVEERPESNEPPSGSRAGIRRRRGPKVYHCIVSANRRVADARKAPDALQLARMRPRRGLEVVRYVAPKKRIASEPGVVRRGLERIDRLVDFAGAPVGAKIVRHSPVPRGSRPLNAMLVPVLESEDPVSQCPAEGGAVGAEGEENWFDLDLGSERTVEAVEIEWFSREEMSVAFSLEAQRDEKWVECLREEEARQASKGRVYRKWLSAPVRARLFRYRQRETRGRIGFMIRWFRLLGPGPEPKEVLMLAPDAWAIDRRVIQEATALVDRGVRVVLLAGFECPRDDVFFHRGIEVRRHCYDWDEERTKEIRTRVASAWLRRLFDNKAPKGPAQRVFPAKPFDAFVLAKARQFRADAIHVHDLPLLKHGVQLAAEWQIPLVFDAHDVYYERETITPQQREELLGEEKNLVNQVDLFMTVSEELADYYARAYPGVEPLALQNYAEPAGDLDPDLSRMYLREKAGLDDSARIVVYHGSMTPGRNLEALVRAAPRFPEGTFLVLIGYDYYLKELARASDEIGAGARVRCLGWRDPAEIVHLLAGADLAVLPRQPVNLNCANASPNTFFELVQAHVPILAQDFPFMKEMENRHGMVAAADLSSAESIAEAVARLFRGKERLESMRRACEEASRLLRWESEAGRMWEAYREILGLTATR